ncbi:hypothetical protein AUP68_00215 [Ilyonectria robusta]
MERHCVHETAARSQRICLPLQVSRLGKSGWYGAAVGLLETKIHIPIISDILNAIGIPDLSFLDFLCWITALSYTVVYKIASRQQGSVPRHAGVQSIISMNSWETLHALLTQPSPPAAPAPPTSPGTIPPVSAEIANSIYIAGHTFASLCSLTAVYINYEEQRWTDEDDESDDSDSWCPKNPWTVPSAVFSVIYTAASYVADTALPKDPIQDTGWKDDVPAGHRPSRHDQARITGPAQGFFETTYGLSYLAVNDPQATGELSILSVWNC